MIEKITDTHDVVQEVFSIINGMPKTLMNIKQNHHTHQDYIPQAIIIKDNNEVLKSTTRKAHLLSSVIKERIRCLIIKCFDF